MSYGPNKNNFHKKIAVDIPAKVSTFESAV